MRVEDTHPLGVAVGSLIDRVLKRMRSERVDRSIDMKAQEPVTPRDTLSTPATLQHDSDTIYMGRELNDSLPTHIVPQGRKEASERAGMRQCCSFYLAFISFYFVFT